MARAVLTVPNISCEHCEHTVTEALTPLAGVQDVKVDIPAHQIHVSYDDSVVGLDTMKDLLKEEDYPVESVA